jgi:hypothetical protein
MSENRGIWRLFGLGLTSCGCYLLVACGSGNNSSGDGDGPAAAVVLTEAPYCPYGSNALKISGTIAGVAIDDSRTGNIDVGLENNLAGGFYTPNEYVIPLADNQLAVSIHWSKQLTPGDVVAIHDGNVTPPASHPQANLRSCIWGGQVGLVQGGAEDGAFKFAITRLKAGVHCDGEVTAVDVRGCYQSQ